MENTAFTVFFSFVNQGQSETGKFTIRLQLDNGQDTADVEAPSYAPGASDFVYYQFPNGLPAGDHFIYAYLDIKNEVVEVTETNNVSYHGFKVGK